MPRTLQYPFCWLILSVTLTAAAGEAFDAAWQQGMERTRLEQWTAARAAFAEAAERAPDRGRKADAELELGRCLLAEGDEVAAMKALVNSMRSRYYSATRLRSAAWPAARDEFQRIHAVPVTRETAETVIFRALADMGIAAAWRKHRAPARAEAHYLKALQWLRAPQVTNKDIQQRDLRSTYVGLAEVRADQHDFAGAQEALRQLLEIPGGLSAQREIKHRLWTLCRLTDGFGAMRTTVRAGISADASVADRVEVQFQIAYSYIYERRYEEARREFTALLAMDGLTSAQRSEGQLCVAHTLFVARRYAQARPLYVRVLSMPDADPGCRGTAQARVDAIDALPQPEPR